MATAIEAKLAAQLYTVRDQLKDDFPGVLRDLHRMGWAGVQISGLHGYDAEEIAAVLKETGLQTAGMHVPIERLTGELPAVLREAELFGTRDIVCPYLTDTWRTEAGYRELRAILNDVSRQVTERGYRVSYHNHDFEFQTTIDGTNALQYLLQPDEANAILAEVDVYWIKKAGEDPLKFIQPYAHRMPIIHLKDMSADDRRAFCEVGEGILDFVSILRWGESSGVEWYAVEQDVCPGDPLESLHISLENLRKYAKLI